MSVPLFTNRLRIIVSRSFSFGPLDEAQKFQVFIEPQFGLVGARAGMIARLASFLFLYHIRTVHVYFLEGHNFVGVRDDFSHFNGENVQGMVSVASVVVVAMSRVPQNRLIVVQFEQFD